jgi:hypothetical protein
MATVMDLIVAQLTRSDVVVRVPEQTRATWRAFEHLLVQIGAALVRVAQSPPSPGYEPYFVEKGGGRLGARGLARVLVRAGHRRARDNQWRGKVVKALRDLAKPLRRKDAVMRRAKTLLRAWEESSILETIFDEAGHDVLEFVRLLGAAPAGDSRAFIRLTEIAAALAPVLTVARGPKMQADSEAHAFFLEIARPFGARGYTWNDLEDDFTDPQTQATRLEFNDKTFNPIPACRLLKRRLSTCP